MNKKFLKEKIEELVNEASFNLRPDLQKLIKNAYLKEKKSQAKKALKQILDNAGIAQNKKLAICQDTGLPVIFIEAGREVKVNSILVKTIKESVGEAYRKNYLRPWLVDPLERGEPSFSGAICHFDFSSRIKGLKITIFPKGFGSENKSQLKMFNPTAEFSQIENFIVRAVKEAGPEACPPFVIGIGIGGTSDSSLLLAKKALIERVDKTNPDKYLASLEKKILKKINSLKIGAMGFGGSNTCLAVKIKKSPTHIAGLPVGINISCHALRSATLKLNKI